MRELLIQLTKRADGSAMLKCVRADGSVTWQRHERRNAAFFPLHDLTHFAIETELGFRFGFYGLIATGWNIDETTGKSPRGPLPEEAIVVERLVGLFDLERTSGTAWTAQQFSPTGREPTERELARVRARLGDLYARWSALAPNETMELYFDRDSRF